MTKKPMPPIADLIAMTPGAQTREQATASLKVRRERLLNSVAPPPTDFVTPEPIPDIETENYAKGFFKRLMDKDQPPPRGSKPRVIIDNKNPEPPPQKK